MTKICTKCGVEYPATSEFFYRAVHKKCGLRSECKTCSNEVTSTYRKKHPERIRANNAKYNTTIKGHLRGVYSGIKRRCNNPQVHNYNRYGGRGIACLFTSRFEFVDYVINTLQVDPRGLQIDRIDNNGNYEPGNIRFVTASINQRNKRGRTV